MRRASILFFIVVGILFSSKLFAQDSVLVYKRNFKKDTIIGDKKYRVWDNWVNFGAGACWLTNNPHVQLAMGMGFNFHIKQIYINMGGYVSGDDKGALNNYNIHLGYIPIRHQSLKYHYAVVAAIAYSKQYPYAYPPHYYWSYTYQQVGFYGELQFIRKLEYTTGLGGCMFIDATPKNFIFGLRLDGYLSGAYRGYAPGKHKKVIQ